MERSLIICVVALLAACGAARPSDTSVATTAVPADPPPMACTEIGCSSELTVELADVDLSAAGTYLVEICISDECVSVNASAGQYQPVSPAAEVASDSIAAGEVLIDPEEDTVTLTLPSGAFSDFETVSFSITDTSTGAEGDELAAVEATEVTFERLQPNGPNCPPVCFVAHLTV